MILPVANKTRSLNFIKHKKKYILWYSCHDSYPNFILFNYEKFGKGF